MFELGSGPTARGPASSELRAPTGGRVNMLVATVAAGLVLAACGAGSGEPGAVTTAPQAGPAAGDTQQPTVDEGARAPQITLEMFDGSTRPLSELYGDRPLIVNFWASWCPPCVAEMPDIEQVHQQLAGQVNFVGINTQDGEEDARRLAGETGVTYPLAWDRQGEIFETFGVFGMPSTFFISSDGRVVERHTGLLTQEALEQKTDELLLEGQS